jgi:hypothetical protein
VGGWGTAKDNFIILRSFIQQLNIIIVRRSEVSKGFFERLCLAKNKKIGDLSERQRGQISIWTQSVNTGLKQPEGLEWNEVTSRVFSERKNLGISRAEENSV